MQVVGEWRPRPGDLARRADLGCDTSWAEMEAALAADELRRAGIEPVVPLAGVGANLVEHPTGLDGQPPDLSAPPAERTAWMRRMWLPDPSSSNPNLTVTATAWRATGMREHKERAS